MRGYKTLASSRYHHGDLKSALIGSAKQILKEDGANALSLRAIASAVGVSHMAPYSHFKNKKELFQAVAASGFNELASNMEAVRKDLTDPKEVILAYGGEYIRFAIDNPQLYRLMLGQAESASNRKSEPKLSQKPQVSIELEASSKKLYSLLRDAFALETDDQAKVKAQALGAWSMVHGMAALIIEGHISIPEGMTAKAFLANSAF